LKRWRALTIGVVALLGTLAIALPVIAQEEGPPDAATRALFRDGSVSCTGADDLSHNGGRVSALAQPQPTGAPGTVFYNLHLRNASPNTTYTLNVSEEPNCTPIYETVTGIVTNAQGRADVYGDFQAPAGAHNFLFNLVATTTPNTPENREIATRNFFLRVP
jgi:hypothetical protein